MLLAMSSAWFKFRSAVGLSLFAMAWRARSVEVRIRDAIIDRFAFESVEPCWPDAWVMRKAAQTPRIRLYLINLPGLTISHPEVLARSAPGPIGSRDGVARTFWSAAPGFHARRSPVRPQIESRT